MRIFNYTSWRIYVVSFIGNQNSLSWTEIPPRAQSLSPKITLPAGEPYEVYGILELHVPGFVISTPVPENEYGIFDGTWARLAKQAFCPGQKPEGVHICTANYRTQIGI